MFVYLSKKIAIPNNVLLKSVAWDKSQGYIACGGSDGLLKVIQLETVVKDPKVRGLAAPSNLSMNQTMDGHSGDVKVVKWNNHFQKLTTSDQKGLIIVWMLFKGQWYEEMINNRNKSVVKAMSWCADGKKICIIYEDGAVIVGSVDGNRIWGKDLRNMQLTQVAWSPDAKIILLGTKQGELHIYDNHGSPIGKVELFCLMNVTGAVSLIALDWYDGRLGYYQPDCPCLVVCFDNGRCQIMKNESDDRPILIDTKMQAVDAKWNDDGSILAIAGSQSNIQQDKQINVVQFFNVFGEALYTLKVPGREITSLDWEKASLRLALAVDSHLYFANIRPNYKWGYLANTVVYAYLKSDRDEHCVSFWDWKNKEKYSKFVSSLLNLTASSSHCCLATNSDELKDVYALLLCNAIGTPMDSKYIGLEPLHMAMSSTHVAVASRDAVYLWQFTTARSLGLSHLDKISNREKLIHIDDDKAQSSDDINFKPALEPTRDPVTCIAISEKIVVVGRESGTIHRYKLPNVELTHRYAVACEPRKIALNCISSRLSIIDSNGILTFFDLDAKITDENGKESIGEHLVNFERKDVWDMKWADDNPELIAIMEKMRMYILRGTDPEEPIPCSGYICQFNDLEIKSVQLDEIFKDPDNPTAEDIIELEVKSLRDTRTLVQTVGMTDAAQFVDDNPHPRLWRLLAEAALEQLNIEVAEHSFVRCKDYQGIKLTKKLNQLTSEPMKLAEIAAYSGKFEEAEKIYLDIDRRDLAIEMRMKLGDWFKVHQLLKSGSSAAEDKKLLQAWNAMGDYYAERHKWSNALSFYQQGGNQEKLAECYYMIEDYDAYAKLALNFPDDHHLLPEMGRTLKMVGMCEAAVDVYVKSGRIKQAIDTCVYLNHWSLAIELAKKHKIKDIDPHLAKYANELLEKKDLLQAIELYRKAEMFPAAAKLLMKVAQQEEKAEASPLQLKKLFVLAALLVEKHYEQTRSKNSNDRIDNYLRDDEDSSIGDRFIVDQAWKGAESYHYYMLAQRQLYGGYVDAAMTTALNLVDYEEFISAEKIHSLIAIASASNRSFAVCSQSFIKLENLEEISEENRNCYHKLATEIFSKHDPRDQRRSRIRDDVDQMIEKPPTCLITGRPITNYNHWTCRVCKRCCHRNEISARISCPLCHSLV